MRNEAMTQLWNVYSEVAENFGDAPEVDQTAASIRSVFDDLGINLYDRDHRDAALSCIAVLGHLHQINIPYKASLGMMVRCITEAEQTAKMRKP